jgi:hypothetical protein
MRDTVCDTQKDRSPIDHWQAHLSSVRVGKIAGPTTGALLFCNHAVNFCSGMNRSENRKSTFRDHA